MFSEGSFSDNDVFVVNHSLDLGNPLLGRVDGGAPKVFHMRDVYGGFDGWFMSTSAIVVGFGGNEDVFESQQQTQLLLTDAMVRNKDVATDCLKAIRKKRVPADNLKQSVANSLLLKIRSVSSKNSCC
ncbi:hypothetical protein L1987_65237 [Smallanthus sonchifolius]|uniref:Uncharacterized protein n=1 Tax=Smallanthus sonchifolius TaxID=185202 RepID=A0ACB9BTT1_9ASTR|nr:hypothetical protein L1987_65237 [Smallanthus sonchifolius]